MNDYVYTEKSGLPVIECNNKYHVLTANEFDLFVEFKTMQHNQTQASLRAITKGEKE